MVGKVSYFSCDKFVNACPAGRSQILKEKGLCRKCLSAGTRSGHKHCRDTYACKHPSHDSDEECHVSVCDEHKKHPENIKLLNRFNEEFIQEKDEKGEKLLKPFTIWANLGWSQPLIMAPSSEFFFIRFLASVCFTGFEQVW